MPDKRIITERKINDGLSITGYLLKEDHYMIVINSNQEELTLDLDERDFHNFTNSLGRVFDQLYKEKRSVSNTIDKQLPFINWYLKNSDYTVYYTPQINNKYEVENIKKIDAITIYIQFVDEEGKLWDSIRMFTNSEDVNELFTNKFKFVNNIDKIKERIDYNLDIIRRYLNNDYYKVKFKNGNEIEAILRRSKQSVETYFRNLSSNITVFASFNSSEEVDYYFNNHFYTVSRDTELDNYIQDIKNRLKYNETIIFKTFTDNEYMLREIYKVERVSHIELKLTTVDGKVFEEDFHSSIDAIDYIKDNIMIQKLNFIYK